MCRLAGVPAAARSATAALLAYPQRAPHLVAFLPAVQADSCEGMGAEETRAYVAAMITEQLGLPGFELLPEQVGPPRGGD